MKRVVGLNAVVKHVLETVPTPHVIWASGGDGGHVILSERHLTGAVELAIAWRRWADEEDVPLRVTCHTGEIAVVTGADGRPQPVGQGINEAGAVVAMGSDLGIVASEPFRVAVESHGDVDAVFHEPRLLGPRNKPLHLLYLMSLPSLAARWPRPRDSLWSSGGGPSEDAWELLYRAKRHLQVHGRDPSVDLSLRRLHPEDFWYRQSSTSSEIGGRMVNPFFGYLDAWSLREVVRVGQLVERDYNEILCRYGDEGNTMFVILRGEIGGYHAVPDGTPDNIAPDFVLRKGQVVGELAFALNRRRTADLVALSDTALLAFSFEEFMTRLTQSPGSSQIGTRVDAFITARVVEHVANHVPYLVGHEQHGPLTTGDAPWQSQLEDILFDCRVLSLPAGEPVTLRATRERFPATEGEGLFVLVSGTFESRSSSEKQLSGEHSALVYANLPGKLVLPDHEYASAGGPVKLLHIGAHAVHALPAPVQIGLVTELKREIARHYHYDAFLSFNFGDDETVDRWRDKLEDAGLRVFVDTLKPGMHFTANIETSLLDSLVLLAFISPHAMTKPQESNWVRKEIAFRETNFQQPWIVPVGLRGADMDAFGMPYTMIDARNDEPAAVQRAVDLITDIRAGREEPPLLNELELRRPFK